MGGASCVMQLVPGRVSGHRCGTGLAWRWGGGRTGDGGLTVYGLVSGIAGRVGLDGVPLAGRGCIY